MTKGSVSGGWAWRHHRKWLRQVVQGGETGVIRDASLGRYDIIRSVGPAGLALRDYFDCGRE